MLTKVIASVVLTGSLWVAGDATVKNLGCCEGSGCPLQQACAYFGLSDCCHYGSECCNPPQECCSSATKAGTSECCSTASECCDPPQECCYYSATKASTKTTKKACCSQR